MKKENLLEIKQISTSYNPASGRVITTALCADDSIWTKKDDDGDWTRINKGQQKD